ncbi:MAG TPA: hypothetical protein ENI97_15195 [Gammaproteobacteria bacterium]|nr:hypothetical protein [Gammaproteobacteria bacterium]
MTSELMRALGRIEGQLKGVHSRLDANDSKLDSIDGRLRMTEIRSARNGAVFGSAAGVGIALIVESIKSHFKANGA